VNGFEVKRIVAASSEWFEVERMMAASSEWLVKLKD